MHHSYCALSFMVKNHIRAYEASALCYSCNVTFDPD